MSKTISKDDYAFQIRAECEKDFLSIDFLLQEAFETHLHSKQNEHLLVEALREQKGLVLADIASDDKGKVIGYIAFSPAYINGVFDGWYTLAPLAVLPEYQGKGVGSALIEHGLKELMRIHAKGIILVGDPTYYRRFGFVASSALGAKGMPSEYLLALALEGDIVQGDVTFHKAFSLFE